ncbi:hypothetical protein D2M30_2050 [Bacillus amyloliquefaciens]|nr:hypothetical protein D2M30_2050 [Bacillus amyloliquefaciens]
MILKTQIKNDDTLLGNLINKYIGNLERLLKSIKQQFQTDRGKKYQIFETLIREKDSECLRRVD